MTSFNTAQERGWATSQAARFASLGIQPSEIANAHLTALNAIGWDRIQTTALERAAAHGITFSSNVIPAIWDGFRNVVRDKTLRKIDEIATSVSRKRQ